MKVLLPTTHNFYVGYLETMGIYVRVNSYRPDEQPLLRCYGLIVSEVPNQTPVKGSEVVLNPVSSGCVSTGDFSPLAEDLVEGDEWLDAYVLASLIDFSNTCFEGVFDSKAAGYATQSCKGHDHATNGGRPVARGRVTTSRNGDFLFSVNAATSFVLVDADETTTRNSEGFGNFRGWVSEGITSGGDEPTSLYLTAEVELTSQGAEDTLTFYVANQNSGFVSPEFSVGVEISPTLKRITLDQIPCVGGEMNEFDLYVKSGTGDPIVTIVSISLFEVAGVGARSPEGSTVSR